MSGIFGGGGGAPQPQFLPMTTPAPLPAPPPNPPMFGAQATKTKGTQSATQGFGASVIGSVPAQQPQRTLLGSL